MAIAVQLINRSTQARKLGLQGFSWTTLFWGPFPALFRGHFLAALVILVAACFTAGLSSIIFAFFYNGWHWNWLTGKGFVPNDHYSMAPIQIVNNVGSNTVTSGL